MQQPPNPNSQYPQQQWQQQTNYGQPQSYYPPPPMLPQQQQWNPQQPPYPPQQQWNPQQPQYQPPMPPPKKKSRKGLFIILGVILAVALIGCIGVSAMVNAGGQATQQALNQTSTQVTQPSQATQQPTLQPTPKPTAQPTQAVRQVTGKATTLGAGTFSGGKDVPVGLYNVTAPGQSGNFIVTGTDTYNEIFGQGVTKIRVQISDGDQIQLSGLSSVTFTPVSTPFVTTHTPATLYAGTFIVGQDIGAGRYVATTTPGSSGNFIVSGANSVNEILGQNGAGGVPNVTTDLSDGDVITISGLGQVTMTPT